MTAAAGIPVLETDRLRLRGWTDDDLDDLAAIYADREVTRWIGIPEPLDRAGTWRRLALFAGHWSLRGYGPWAVEERGGGSVIGHVGLWQPDGWPGLEVGWTLGRPWQGRGYATEAARASLGFAFGQLGAERVVSIIDPANRPSTRVAERIGERFERLIPWFGGEAALWGIERGEWERGGRAR